MRKAMKKIIVILSVSMMLTGCSNEFAKIQYDDTEKIVAQADKYAKSNSSLSSTDGMYSMEVGLFDGRETIWFDNVSEETDIDVEVVMSLSKGTAKVVFIDSDNNITTLVECTSDNTSVEAVQTVSLKEGKNRIKLVGYDAKDIDLTFYSTYFK